MPRQRIFFGVIILVSIGMLYGCGSVTPTSSPAPSPTKASLPAQSKVLAKYILGGYLSFDPRTGRPMQVLQIIPKDGNYKPQNVYQYVTGDDKDVFAMEVDRDVAQDIGDTLIKSWCTHRCDALPAPQLQKNEDGTPDRRVVSFYTPRMREPCIIIKTDGSTVFWGIVDDYPDGVHICGPTLAVRLIV